MINLRRRYNNCKYLYTQHRRLQYIRQVLTAIKWEIVTSKIIVGDFNTPLSPMDRSSKRKINKETQALNDTLNNRDLSDIYSTFHPKQQDTHPSQVHMEQFPG